MKIKFFEMARKLTTNSDHCQHKMACIIAKKNKVVNFGWNMNRTHPVSKSNYNTLHAEVSALLGMSYEDLKGCDAYIYRETKLATLGEARPCSACFNALKIAGIKKIHYSSPDGFKTEYL